ncbi:hypothetical protein [Vibrio phage D4]|nr:hypothetical protein vBVcaS_HC051 [Vibrio phage vB_VcaS_HC]UHD87312.1 hypothetical protein [Vibrio phage D4]WKV32812.1 hypothetical protein R21Y_51 [Vibrio phage vB_VhaS_R21Y]
MQEITAENVLKIANLAPGFCPDMDASHVNRLCKGKEIETLQDACKRLDCNPDQLIHEGRKSLIRCAMLYSRFNSDIKKPDAFAMHYADGKLDAIPNNVCEYISKHLTEEIDFKQITEVKKNEYKIGDPTGAHINVSRICGDPVVYMCNTFSADSELIDETRVECTISSDLNWLY